MYLHALLRHRGDKREKPPSQALATTICPCEQLRSDLLARSSRQKGTGNGEFQLEQATETPDPPPRPIRRPPSLVPCQVPSEHATRAILSQLANWNATWPSPAAKNRSSPLPCTFPVSNPAQHKSGSGGKIMRLAAERFLSGGWSKPRPQDSTAPRDSG